MIGEYEVEISYLVRKRIFVPAKDEEQAYERAWDKIDEGVARLQKAEEISNIEVEIIGIVPREMEEDR